MMKVHAYILALLVGFIPLATTAQTITVAVTALPSESDHEGANTWTADFFAAYAQAHNLQILYKVVPFDDSWLLAENGAIDIIATGVTALPSRRTENTAWTQPYLQVKRGLKIHKEDADRFAHIDDFVGHKVAAVKGMTALSDLELRAPEGVEVVVLDDWDALYTAFENHDVDAIAEGYYVSVDERINQIDLDHPMIDAHDLIPGEPEYLVFVLQKDNTALLDSLNAFIDEAGFPIQ